MKPVIAHLFPLTIYKSKILISESEKKLLINEVYEMEKKSANPEYKSNNKAWTGDTQGHEYLHNNPKFSNLFKEIEIHVKKYLEYLSLDANSLDLYFQRSWATISRNFENINFHKHSQSHISFAYYLKKNKNDARIIFSNESRQNEILGNLFSSQTLYEKKIIKKIDLVNTNQMNLDIEEDDIVIFPSKTSHGTESKVNNDVRISFSADISIISKDSTSLEHLITPVENWKKFSY